ncbi:hypothetical protein KDH_07030 [Dictyobacter sp. S3.2.2.5]|uniref:Uncharacterized protein n=1 Tax=Dictyobacter halimunensis TaxID=3026934 RepID=A0ABQ6FI92_9CHLR|nr:hypothetical protein KDH_07030 [Dictyobacter sp. S3.2.2.5]
MSSEEGVGDYVAVSGQGLAGGEYETSIQDFVNSHPSHEFSWGLGDIVTAVLDSALTLTSLREYLYINDSPPFANMITSEGRWSLPPDQPNMPQMFSLTARK